MYELREIAPSQHPDGWLEVYAAIREADVRTISVRETDTDQLLGTAEVSSGGSTTATLLVENDGVSRASSGDVWRPVLPLVDIAPLNVVAP